MGERNRRRLKTSASADSANNHEMFRRIKADEFVSMIVQNDLVEREKQLLLGNSGGDEDVIVSSTADIAKTNNKAKPSYNIITGETVGGQPDDTPVDTSAPFIVFDTRLDDAFHYGHIKTAFNFPYTMLSRERFETNELKAFKNLPGRLIIVYDDNEMSAPKVASTLVQRGYENCLLLSGGIIGAVHRYHSGLISGSVWDPSHPPNVGLARSNGRVRSVGSLERFTPADIAALQEQLKTNIMPNIAKSHLMEATASAAGKRRSRIAERKLSKGELNDGKKKAWK